MATSKDNIPSVADAGEARGRMNASLLRPPPQSRARYFMELVVAGRRSAREMSRTNVPARRGIIALAIFLTAALTTAVAGAGYVPFDGPRAQRAPGEVMLILRGIASREHPRGQLDDRSALEYARRLGYQAVVLDVACHSDGESSQVRIAL